MSFTEEEKRAWHQAKPNVKMHPETKFRTAPVTECIHRGQQFGYGEGFIPDEVSLCDARDSDEWPEADGPHITDMEL